MKHGNLLRIIGLIAMASTISACGVKLDLWGAKVDFPEGLDLRVGGNSIDTVTDKRGVNSKEGFYEAPRRTRGGN